MHRWQIHIPILIFGFLLGIYEGRIALWMDGIKKPVYVSEYSANILPPADRERLEKGICVKDREQLNRLLEDYLS